jgi:hypothetical protein
MLGKPIILKTAVNAFNQKNLISQNGVGAIILSMPRYKNAQKVGIEFLPPRPLVHSIKSIP